MDPKPSVSSKSAIFARRLGSTLLLWGLVTGIFASRHPWGFLGLIGTLAACATVEYFAMLRKAGIPCFPRLGIALAVAYMVAASIPMAAGKATPARLDEMFFALAVVSAFIAQLRHPVKGSDPLQAAATSVFGFAYVAFLFGFTAKLVFTVPGGLTESGKVSTAGAFLLLWLLAVTKFSDMGAYITGSLIGRHKMIPHVSPAKTWEGFAGAIAFSLLAACALFALFPQQLEILGGWRHVVVLGVLLSVVAVVGDLGESLVKRSTGAKDSGHMLPGIGGALDLIDSICFTAPILYFYLQWLHSSL